MTSDYISSKICIARVFDRFDIKYSGFIPRVPNWIYTAMSILDSKFTLIDKTVEGEVIDYKCEIPPETKELVFISYNNKKLPEISTINNSTSDMELLNNLTDRYEISGNYIITTFREGVITFYIKTLPIEFDDEFNLYFPLIPNNEELLNGLDNYILYRILQRGHIIEGYSLRENNPYTNPGLAWEMSIQKIRNSLSALSYNDRIDISSMIRNFIHDKNYIRSKFNSNYKQL